MIAMAIERTTEVELPFRLDLSTEAATMLNRIALASMLDHTLPDELRAIARDINDLLNPHLPTT